MAGSGCVGVVETFVFDDDGAVPNSILPLLIHRAAIDAADPDPASRLERLFAGHDWTRCWRNGIFDYHHYHSTAHEVLGIATGGAVVRFGGAQGRDVALAAGDVVVLPAGLGHRRVRQDDDLLVVGAYAQGRSCDIVRAEPGRIAEARRRIAAVPLPDADPVEGSAGALVRLWSAAVTGRAEEARGHE